ncbi:MAG: molybdenum cofactor guanylyltransferase [Armatimonadota bacterium]
MQALYRDLLSWVGDTSIHSNKFAAVVLAGGRASRYGGVAKGLIEISPGTSIIAKMIEVIRGAGLTEIAISANDLEPYKTFGLPILADLRAGLGPVGGIEAGLSHFREISDAVLFLPCDLPSITKNEISTLISAFEKSEAKVVFARDGSFFGHPLCAVVHNAVLPSVSKFIDEGHRKISELWASLGAVPVQFDDGTPFYNVNTPADLACWKGKQTMASKISVPSSLLKKVEGLILSEGLAIDIVPDEMAVLRIVEAQGRVECDGSTLQSGGWIRCSAVRGLAEKLGVSYKQMGMLMDLLEIKIRECELGCF